MELGETSFPIVDKIGEEEAGFDVDFDLETYFADRKKVLYPAADIVSTPRYSQAFLDLKPGKATLSDFSEEARIDFKDKEGNCSLVKADPALVETLCPAMYARYQQSVDKDRGGQPGSWSKSPETHRIRAELLDELKIKLTEFGFDFHAEEETNKAFEGANYAWQEAYRKRYDARHIAKKQFELPPDLAGRANVLYPAADIASEPRYSQAFLDITPGKAIATDFGGEVRIDFKDKEGNSSLLKMDESLIETLCVRTYARYQQSIDRDRGGQPGSWSKSPETHRIRAELLDELKVKLTEFGFDFDRESDTNAVFDGANHAWQEAVRQRHDVRHMAKTNISL